MKAMIHTKLGVIKTHLDRAVVHHMKNMTYSSLHLEVGGGLFPKKVAKPHEDATDYWPIMAGFYPWNEIPNFYSALCVFGPDADISISVDLAGALFIKETK